MSLLNFVFTGYLVISKQSLNKLPIYLLCLSPRIRFDLIMQAVINAVVEISLSCLCKKLPRTKMEQTSRQDVRRFFLKVDKVAFLLASQKPSEQIEIRLFQLTWFGQRICNAILIRTYKKFYLHLKRKRAVTGLFDFRFLQFQGNSNEACNPWFQMDTKQLTCA